jgi:hypothetical protein
VKLLKNSTGVLSYSPVFFGESAFFGEEKILISTGFYIFNGHLQ